MTIITKLFNTKTFVATVLIVLMAAGVLWISRADRPDVHTSTQTRRIVANDPPTNEGVDTAPLETRAVVVENGTLSLALQGQQLGPVLAEIAKQSGVRIYSLPVIDSRRVTMEIQRQPLDRGLQMLLGDCDVFFYSAAGSLRAAWIYESNHGAQLAPVPPESWASNSDMLRQANAGSATERISAIEALVARNGPNSGDLVNQALIDSNAEVRFRALNVALSAGVNVPRETLTTLTDDSSAPVRALALEALASLTEPGGPRDAEMDQLIRGMLGDADAQVRAKAQELLAARSGAN